MAEENYYITYALHSVLFVVWSAVFYYVPLKIQWRLPGVKIDKHSDVLI